MEADKRDALVSQPVEQGEAAADCEVAVEVASEGPGRATEGDHIMAQGIPADQDLLPAGLDEDGGVAGCMPRRRHVGEARCDGFAWPAALHLGFEAPQGAPRANREALQPVRHQGLDVVAGPKVPFRGRHDVAGVGKTLAVVEVCVGGSSNVPLGFISLTENLTMVAMAIWMLTASGLGLHLTR